jgi:two-component system CheB/CheR fusion protein
MPRHLYALTVLVVDDDPDAAESLAHLIRHCGHEAHTAYGPTDTILATDRDPPDVVFMDIGLLGTDGYRLARKICERLTCKPLLVAITGQPGLEERSRDEGFDRHFLKPADPGELVTLLYAHAKKLAGEHPRA